MDMLNDSLQCLSPKNFCCEKCSLKSKIVLYEDPKKKYGLTEKLMFYSGNCKNTLKSLNTSKATSLSNSNIKAFEVNIRSILATVPIG